MVMKKGAQKRLDLLLAIAQEKFSPQDEVYLTIDRNPGWASVMDNKIPTLLQKSSVWSTRARRLLLPKEVCFIMGLRWTPLMETFPEIKIRSMAGNAMHSGCIASVLLFALGNTIAR